MHARTDPINATNEFRSALLCGAIVSLAHAMRLRGVRADEWTNDTAFLKELAPVALKALDWVIDVGTGGSPLPKRQCCTYDIIQFEGYDHTSFNSMMYLAALRAGERLAGHLGAPALAVKCRAAYAAAVPYMNATLWNATHGYFRAWADLEQGAPPWVMADTLYGQVIANVLGLKGADGERWLVPPEMVARHLKVEAEFNPSPCGSRTQPGRSIASHLSALYMTHPCTRRLSA